MEPPSGGRIAKKVNDGGREGGKWGVGRGEGRKRRQGGGGGRRCRKVGSQFSLMARDKEREVPSLSYP